jgi:hypothetical protein
MLTISLTVDGVQRKIKTLARTAADLQPALKIFDAYYKGRLAERFAKCTLTVDSKIPWAGSHNEGDTVGHGAHLPARPFNYLGPIDFDVLVEILVNRLLIAVS